MVRPGKSGASRSNDPRWSSHPCSSTQAGPSLGPRSRTRSDIPRTATSLSRKSIGRICRVGEFRVKRLDPAGALCYPRRMAGKPLVGIIMGSKTDLEILQGAVEILREFGIDHELRILSAHRTPERVLEWAQTAEERGLEVLIAGAGSAAALPGVVAAKTVLPVLGVPVASTSLGGVDALLSIVQMPKGVPVGTLAIGKGGAANAALLAVSILAAKRPDLREKLRAWRKKRADEVLKSDAEAQGK